jgi:hypothetical protein
MGEIGVGRVPLHFLQDIGSGHYAPAFVESDVQAVEDEHRVQRLAKSADDEDHEDDGAEEDDQSQVVELGVRRREVLLRVEQPHDGGNAHC